MNNDAIITENAIKKLEEQKREIDKEIRTLKQLAWTIKIGSVIEYKGATNKDFQGQFEVIGYDPNDHWICIRKENPIILLILDKNKYTIIKHLDEKERLTRDEIMDLNLDIKNGR